MNISLKTSFNGVFDGKTVLVTGHTGFKGSWLCTWLSLLGAKVVGVSDKIPTDPSHYKIHSKSLHFKDYRLDIRDNKELSELVESLKPDFLFHLAAQPIVSESIRDPFETISVNALGMASVLESIRHVNHSIVCILITSDKCYENVEWCWGYKETDRLGGKDPYSASKACAEVIFSSYFRTFICENENVKVASVRAGNVIGGGDWSKDRIIVDCISSWCKNEPVELRAPNATRPWQHVLEPLSGYLAVAEALTKQPIFNGESYNFGPQSNESKTVKEVVIDLYNRKPVASTLKHPYVISESSFMKEAKLLSLNIDKACFELKWKPTLSFEKTMDFVSEWYTEYLSNNKIVTSDQIFKYTEIARSNSLSWA